MIKGFHWELFFTIPHDSFSFPESLFKGPTEVSPFEGAFIVKFLLVSLFCFVAFFLNLHLFWGIFWVLFFSFCSCWIKQSWLSVTLMPGTAALFQTLTKKHRMRTQTTWVENHKMQYFRWRESGSPIQTQSSHPFLLAVWFWYKHSDSDLWTKHAVSGQKSSK